MTGITDLSEVNNVILSLDLPKNEQFRLNTLKNTKKLIYNLTKELQEAKEEIVRLKVGRDRYRVGRRRRKVVKQDEV